MQKKPKLSILIVYYNENKELLECLISIRRAELKINFEVVLVDNSRDDKVVRDVKKFSWVKYIKAPGNLGYGRGINLAAKNAKGKYILVLNPDTRIFPRTIERLLRFVERKKGKVAVAPMLVDKNLNKFPLLGSHALTPLRAIFSLSFINKLVPNNKISRSYWIKTKDKKSAYGADVIPGIFLVNKSTFDKVAGFDKNFFLYFEDTDLFKRLKDKGYSLYILPTSKVLHHRSVATSKNREIKRIVSQSRFYYFKKHYGYLSALIVEAFARFSKWHAALIVITIIGAFVRLYRIEENFVFQGELGYDYVTIKNFVLQGKIPLLGPPTSHAWFALGPLFYWLFSVILPLGNYHPFVGEYFWVSIGTLAIIISFFVVKEFFGQRAGLISSYMIAISPAWIKLTRGARHNFPAAVLFFPIFYFLIKNLREKANNNCQCPYGYPKVFSDKRVVITKG